MTGQHSYRSNRPTVPPVPDFLAESFPESVEEDEVATDVPPTSDLPLPSIGALPPTPQSGATYDYQDAVAAARTETLPAYSPGPNPPYPAVQPASAQPPATSPVPRPEDLLPPDPAAVDDRPAQWGWRGWVNRVTGGAVAMRPSSVESGQRLAAVDIQRGFSRPMTVVVIQPKGGAGKTPTTIGLASALGSHRGGYIVGWDNNETRGTLAVRITNSDGQRTTTWDLLAQLPSFERTDARVGHLSPFVRPQGEAHFDALVSDDNPANMVQLDEDAFRRVHAVLQRFYRLIVIDTGNNVRSPNWQAAVNAADTVVVVSTYQRDVGYSGSWVLDHLVQTGREELARNAVTVLTAADPRIDAKVRGELLTHFAARTRAVVEVPFDPLIASGGPIRWTQLSPRSRQAWVRAGATVVTALAARDQR